MTEHNDHDLGEQFHALRREDAAAVPPFHGTLAAVRARVTHPHRRALGLAAVGIVAAGVVLALLFARRDRHGVTIDLATVHWQAPTDFLLALPGEELLRTVPKLVTIDSDRRTP